MQSFLEKNLQEYLNMVGSKTSTPGGGSVLGYVLSLSCSLNLMVILFSENKKGYEQYNDEYQLLKNKILHIQKEVNILVDEDALAFNNFMEDYRQKKNLNDAATRAADVPYKLYQNGKKVAEIASRLTTIGSKNIVSDAKIALDLATSIFSGCIENIKCNLPYIEDENEKEKLRLIIE
jgi:glutamate formiminotransferase/formiminotetrahydrofolate cyclodeaminase